jgi:hypothetical protein
MNKKGYTIGTFILDIFLGAITCGLWWIYRLFKILSSK